MPTFTPRSLRSVVASIEESSYSNEQLISFAEDRFKPAYYRAAALDILARTMTFDTQDEALSFIGMCEDIAYYAQKNGKRLLYTCAGEAADTAREALDSWGWSITQEYEPRSAGYWA